jgi:hypothetical protein
MKDKSDWFHLSDSRQVVDECAILISDHPVVRHEALFDNARRGNP